MPHRTRISAQTIPRDLLAGLVVFLVALPLCLGVALASNAPLISGIISGVIGGIVIGAFSKSQTSVSGPSPSLIAVIAAQIVLLGSFEAFLTALVIAGFIQFVMGTLRLGFFAEFVPSAVIKGLLAAIGLILILKQIPHILGHDTDPEGEMSFVQPDHENTFSELFRLMGDIHPTAVVVGLTSLVMLLAWDRLKFLKRSFLPAPLAVVIVGTLISEVARMWIGGKYTLGGNHLVNVPIAASLVEFRNLLPSPDFTRLFDQTVLFAGIQIALIASLETLLNLEAVDKLDPRRRISPPSRELVAQGIGNTLAGLLGGIPISSVIVRSSVNIQARAETRMSAIAHGVYLLGSVLLLPTWLNRVPLSCLAAILLITGFKLASPRVAQQIWRQGWIQFLPYATTVVAIVFTDLFIGVLVGLAASIGFILHGNMRRPVRCTIERHLTGPIYRIELASQVTFLNRAALSMQLDQRLRGQHVLIDARNTHSIDLDILDLIEDYVDNSAPARGVKVNLIGFQGRFALDDNNEDVDFASRELQQHLEPSEVLQILRDGNERFCTGTRLPRDLGREVRSTSAGQFPLAVILSCIDSRSPAELIFDAGVGDLFNVRIAGHVAREKVLASIEYACAVAGTKLVVVMGHTKCGAVSAAVNMRFFPEKLRNVDCEHLDVLVNEIQLSIAPNDPTPTEHLAEYTDEVARRNVLHTVRKVRLGSQTLDRLVHQGKILIVGGMYDVCTGRVTFLQEPTIAENGVAAATPLVTPFSR